MKKIICVTLLAVLSIATLNAAENSNLGQGGYLGLEAGYAKLENSNNGVGLGRLFAGYNFNENLGLELGGYRTSNTDYYYPGATFRVYAYGTDASLMLRPSISSGLHGLFIRAGGHYDQINADCYGYCYGLSKWGGGVLAGLGYDATIGNNLSARLSYTYLDDVAGSGRSANTGSLGLMYNF